MVAKQIFDLLNLLIPAISNLICCIIICLDIYLTPVQRERRIKLWLIAFFFTCFSVWLSLMVYGYFPEAYYHTHRLWYFALFLFPVLLYVVIRKLTPELQRRLPVIFHLLMPFAAVILCYCWTLLSGNRSVANGITSYNGLETRFDIQALTAIVFSFVYMGICLAGIVRTRLRLEPDFGDTPLYRKWMKVVVPVSVIVMLFPAELIFAARETTLRSFGLSFWVFLLVSVHIICCINLIKRKYPVPTLLPRSSSQPLSGILSDNPAHFLKTSGTCLNVQDIRSGKTYEKLNGKVTRRSFDAWFSRHKPFLDPELKMEKILDSIELNRNQFSAFINQNYGMSFVNYVAHWRLRELEKLKKMPANRTATLNSLLSQAGFGSYKSYRRALEYHTAHNKNQ